MICAPLCAEHTLLRTCDAHSAHRVCSHLVHMLHGNACNLRATRTGAQCQILQRGAGTCTASCCAAEASRTLNQTAPTPLRQHVVRSRRCHRAYPGSVGHAPAAPVWQQQRESEIRATMQPHQASMAHTETPEQSTRTQPRLDHSSGFATHSRIIRAQGVLKPMRAKAVAMQVVYVSR